MTTLLPFTFESPAPVPSQLHGYLSVNSIGGQSVLEASKLSETTDPFHGTKKDANQARKAAEASGLSIVAESRLGLAVVGPPEAYEELTGGKVVTQEVLLYAEAATRRYVTHIDITGKNQPLAVGCARPKSNVTGIEAVILEKPRAPQAAPVWIAPPTPKAQQSGGIWPSPIPPNVPGFYLRVPQDVALGLGAPQAQKQGFRGQGVRVAMVDTGFYLHPFFPAHHYQIATPIAVVPGVAQGSDPVGHGTGESANIFANAPDAQLQPIRASNEAGDLVAAVAGFMKAKSLSGDKRPQIISNSWGGDMQFPSPTNTLPPQEIAFALELKDAVELGIFVVFSAGNGQFSTEPQVPEVFAAGGTYMSSNMALQASNYASGYESPFFPHRIVPDACGLVGLLPRAQYIMLPIPPSCQLDIEESQADDQGNAGDGTPPNDGWALFSGTSAAAPQVAGAAAALLSAQNAAKPHLTPAQIKEALTQTCVDIRFGTCHPRFNNPAGPGQDLATGFGLVNITAALEYARNKFPASF
jgi:subtilisin family serine protease